MEIDGPTIVWYVINGLAIVALLALIIMHFAGERSGIDWTLFQIYVLCGLSIASLMPASIAYGSGVPHLVPVRGDLCVIQAQVSHFFLLALRMFPILLCFQLWWFVVMGKQDPKNRFGLYGSVLIYVFCLAVTAAEIVLEFNAPNMGVSSLRFYCSLQYDSVYSLTMEVPSALCAVIGLGFTIHSSIHLYKTFKHFQKHPNRRTHIRRSLLVRLCIWSILYTLISGVLAINNLVLMVRNEHGLTDREYNQPILEFTAAGSGFVLLLIFGTTKNAAIFLPCFSLPSANVFSKSRSKKADSWNYDSESQKNLTGTEVWQHRTSSSSWPHSTASESLLSLPLALPAPRVNLTDSRVFEPSFSIDNLKFPQGVDTPPRAQSPAMNPFMARTKNAVGRVPEMEMMASNNTSQDTLRHHRDPALNKTDLLLNSVTESPRIEPKMPSETEAQISILYAGPSLPVDPPRPVMFRPSGYLESRFSWDSTPATPQLRKKI